MPVFIRAIEILLRVANFVGRHGRPRSIPFSNAKHLFYRVRANVRMRKREAYYLYPFICMVEEGLAGKGAIAVTQRRRVAAISIAKRVALSLASQPLLDRRGTRSLDEKSVPVVLV